MTEVIINLKLEMSELLKKNAPIGVLDSGVGGLSVLKCLKTMLPHEDFIYLGDTARTPYGPRSEAEVRQFVGEMLDYFETQGAKLVVIACNTLTVLGVDTLKGNHEYDIIGMSKGANLVLNASRNKTIGVFATEFTINSGAHKAAILAVDSTATVVPKACPKFVPRIEGERFDSPEIKAAIAEYALPLKAAGVDTMILSCTHYPFIKKEIEDEMGAGVKVIDPAEQTALDTKAALEDCGLLQAEGSGKTTICFTADLERGKRIAARMFDVEACTFQNVTLGK